jgi:hypothetical protein
MAVGLNGPKQVLRYEFLDGFSGIHTT